MKVLDFMEFMPEFIENEGKLIKIYCSEKNVDKSVEISWLMSQDNKEHAISLQLDNLVLTYGYEAVKKVFETKEGL